MASAAVKNRPTTTPTDHDHGENPIIHIYCGQGGPPRIGAKAHCGWVKRDPLGLGPHRGPMAGRNHCHVCLEIESARR